MQSALALLVLRVFADHPDHPAAVDDLALRANLLYRCSDLHFSAALLRASMLGSREISTFELPASLPADVSSQSPPTRPDLRKLKAEAKGLKLLFICTCTQFVRDSGRKGSTPPPRGRRAKCG